MSDRKRLTDRSLMALRPQAQRYEVWEPSGLGVRVTPNGRRTFVWYYRTDRLTRRLTIGEYPTVTLAAARVRLAQAREAVKGGRDPGRETVEGRKADRQAETMAELAAEYLERHARPNKRSAAEDERQLRRDVLPAWGRRKARTITRRDVVTLLDRITDRGAPIAANRMLTLLHRVFRFALDRDIVAANPCAGIGRPAKERPRERVLRDAEMTALWEGLEAAAMAPQTRLAIRFLLATGQRVGEVAAMPWDELDEGAALWRIPGARAKNGTPHTVPLNSLALDVLAEARTLAQERHPRLRESLPAGAPEPEREPWVFPSSVHGRSLTPLSVARAMRDNLAALGLAANPATPHDLRRSVASHLTALGVPRLVVGKLLNHRDRDVTGRVYDKHSYLPEVRAAVETWGRHLAAVLGETASNVVALRGAAS